ncbi:arf GTPase activating protein drongo isoform X2 [Leptinotarsa decemlineata]|uniref:arf GTPase activating protein drongo isoform X2 n=1 Tax=Leptinotarsa decemlineata TaxID=7539 RepID=UPI003D304A28
MASSRKKQDEKNLKTLRELGAFPQNKYCFDCNQRGPTYVNVTIGSFVCTKCSGMLRGITPPHRVKSISMATFTNEEIDLLRNRGNQYCRRVWLGLYEGASPGTDETSIKDFMVEKYEKRRYYLDPVHSKVSEVASQSPLTTDTPKAAKVNGAQMQSAHRTRPEVNRNNVSGGFAVDFDRADIFGAGKTTTMNGNHQEINAPQQNGFANFDNNPVFGNSANTATNTGFPTQATFNNINNWSNLQSNPPPLNGSLNGTLNGSLNGTKPQPAEDKYAALKDLDNEIKSQKSGQLDWNSTGSNGSLYSSPTPTGSVYSSPSPQSSIFGSPSQGQFMTAFSASQENGIGNISNPFNSGGVNSVNWGNVNGVQPTPQSFANPFRDPIKSNGSSHQVFQPITAFSVNTVPVAVNGTNGWTANPFKVGGTSTMNSNNPFL